VAIYTQHDKSTKSRDAIT